jgi:superfamily I DNA and/or RNA helicase
MVVQHSSQGNEADYIIISLVRTEGMGFLDNNRRANVLLTRCKKGMFVMTSRELMMKDRSRETLLGKFAYTWDASQVSFDI